MIKTPHLPICTAQRHILVWQGELGPSAIVQRSQPMHLEQENQFQRAILARLEKIQAKMNLQDSKRSVVTFYEFLTTHESSLYLRD